jgi:hypothetical protein
MTIFEPFAGSAGYALRHYEKQVQIYESNQYLAGLWKWLIGSATSDLIRAIPIDLPEGTDIQALDLEKGQKLLLKHWQRTNNYGDCWTISPWGNKPGQWTANTRARVAEQFEAVRHWSFAPVFYNMPGTYFIDPPYLYNYRYGAKTFDHVALASTLSQIPHPYQIVACEALCPKTGKRPHYLPFADFRSVVTSRRKTENHHHSNELLFYAERLS